MKLFAATAVPLMLAAAPALAQTTPAPAPAPAPASTPTPAPAAPAAASRLNLDTPIETIVADANGKKVLDADLPGLANNANYDMFKWMSLNQVAAMASDKLTPERLAKVAIDLAAIR